MPPLRASFYFFDSFLAIGLQTVVPQVFFLRVAAGGGHGWLSLCLLLGAGASFLGVYASRQRPVGTWPGGHGGQSVPVILALTVAALLFGLFAVSVPTVFVALYALATLVMAYLYDGTDNRWLRSLPLQRIRIHVTGAIVSQAVGSILAPLLFALFVRTVAVYAVPVAGGALLVAVMRSLGFGSAPGPAAAPPASGAAAPTRAPAQTALSRADWTFLAYTLCMFAAVLVVAANAILLSSSYFRLAHPTRVAGELLAVANLFGVVAVISYMALPPWLRRRKKDPQAPAQVRRTGPMPAAAARTVPAGHGSGFSLGVHLALVGSMLLAAFMLFIRASNSLPYVLALGAIAGASLGFFRLLAREYASRRVALFGRTRLLSMFNSLHGSASLLAYALMAAGAVLHAMWHVALGALMVDCMGGLALLALGLVLALEAAVRRESQDVAVTAVARAAAG